MVKLPVICNLNISVNYTTPFLDNMYSTFDIITDREFGNLLLKFEGDPVRSTEGNAFVVIGVDSEGRISYISIIPEDQDLKVIIKNLK